MWGRVSRRGGQLGRFGIAEAQGRCCLVVLWVCGLGGAGDRQDGFGAGRQPRQCHLGRAGVVGGCDRVGRAAGTGQFPCADRCPGSEADAVPGAVLRDVGGGAVGEVVVVADGGGVDDRAGLLGLVEGGLGEAEGEDFSPRPGVASVRRSGPAAYFSGRHGAVGTGRYGPRRGGACSSAPAGAGIADAPVVARPPVPGAPVPRWCAGCRVRCGSVRPWPR